ncbi:pentapeptide repeat-containing protein [Amycolatopsis sp. NPDC049868]|uniref:pentapeptide repeat-containing protein n=1 Tax=Amycolatopsis sp. NPDC049868 TaxID=3363934 RepID=UPI0037BCB484
MAARFRRWLGADPEWTKKEKARWAIEVFFWNIKKRHLEKLRGKSRFLLLSLTIPLLTFAILAAIWIGPTLLDSQTIGRISDPKEQLNSTNQSRTLILQSFIALAGLATVLYTARNYFLSRSGQASDRLSAATERLSSESRVQRVGAVYALTRLMRDSAVDHRGIVDILSSYIKESVPRTLPQGDDEDSPSDLEEIIDEEDYEYMWYHVPERPELDIDAAIRALIGRPKRYESPWITIGQTRLVGARFLHSEIQNIHLEGADLRGADFVSVRSTNFALHECDLRGVNFSGAVLRTGHFSDSDMRYAYFRWVDFSGSLMGGVDLRGATFSDAILHDCDLSNADLRGVDMSSVQGLTKDAIEGAIVDDETILPKNLSK